MSRFSELDVQRRDGKDTADDTADTHLIHVTIFETQAAGKLTAKDMTLGELHDLVLGTSAKEKGKLPFLKLARFGEKRTDKNSLRNNANVIAISGIELDYDGKKMPFETAIAMTEETGLHAMLYTSASYTKDEPKWRIVLPTSRELEPEAREKLVARVNGIFSGIFAGESFVLSQSFYYGKVNDNPEHQCKIVDGDFVDLRDDLDQGAMGKSGNPRGNGSDDQVEDEKYMEDIRSSKSYHPSLLALSARQIGRGVDAETVAKTLRELLEQSVGPRDDRWHAALADITKLIASAVEKYGRETNDRRRREQIARNIEIGNDVTEPIFPTIMTLAEMQERLVFIGGSGAVVDRITGRVRKKEHAYAEYAASLHQYTDKDGKQKEIPALKLWIASPQRMTVDALAWVPGSPQICQPPEPMGGAKTAFNSWRGITPMDAPPDWKIRAEPFFEHVKFLVPIEDERNRFLQWLAHIIQHPEILPHTSYLMITPKTGIGRNLMASIIVRALRGHVAAGVSLPELLDGGFNGRLSQKLLAIVDEVREGGGERRHQRAESVKRLVTEVHRRKRTNGIGSSCTNT